jgi:cytochrome c peroxidase
MRKSTIEIRSYFPFFRRNLFGATALLLSAGVLAAPWASAQNIKDNAADRAWQPGAIGHAQKMRRFHDHDSGKQPTPAVIPKFEIDSDPTGAIATDQPAATLTARNPFFADLGTNNRTCFTCHQPQTGWGISADSVQARFNQSLGTDPIFRLVDGATCPTDDVSNLAAKRKAYNLLTSKGLIRIALPMPANAEFQVASVKDPYDCTTNPTTGLTSPTAGIVSIYRRPLPSTNLGFLTGIMWDGREPDLFSQAVDATLGHAQGQTAPTQAQQQQIVAFESGLLTAQFFDNGAKALSAGFANGGPVALNQTLDDFFLGINDPFGLNPQKQPFTSTIFDLYDSWGSLRADSRVNIDRKQIARGQALFNNTQINVTGVAGINDVLGQPVFKGVCGTCHDTPDVGNHSVSAPLNIGIANAGASAPPVLDIADLPVFTLQCTSGPLQGQSFTVTDPGRALISGKCADIGKTKGPILRGLAARAPYFHNGSAATLMDVVNFYDQRFNIGFTAQNKADLVAFLGAL